MEVVVGLLVCVALVWLVTRFIRKPTTEPQAWPTQRSKPPLSSSDGEESFYAKIHGVSHRNSDGSSRQASLKRCWPGEQRLLIREPNNRYDTNAIKVCRAEGMQLGYISADVAARDLAPQMDAGAIVAAEISEVTGGTADKPTRGANILIRVQKPPEPSIVLQSEDRLKRQKTEELPYRPNVRVPNDPVKRNLKGSRLEHEGFVDNAIQIYEANVQDGYEGGHPYDRLAIIFRRRGEIDREIAVLKRAIEVFEGLQNTSPRLDVPTTLEQFKKRLGRASKLREKHAARAQK